MHHWLQLATRSWQAKPGRAIASIVAIALGVGTVVSITCFYASIRQSIADQVVNTWLGRSHLTVEPPLGHWGHVDQALTVPLAKLNNVAKVAPKLKRVVTAVLSSADEQLRILPVDAIGLDPAMDYFFRDYQCEAGRLIQPGDTSVAVIEEASAREWGLKVGDTLRLAVASDRPPEEFKLIGTYDVRRIAEFQRPTVLLTLDDLQRLKHEPGQVNSIDVMLEDTTPDVFAKTREQAGQVVSDWNRDHGGNAQLSTAETKMNQLREAERFTELLLTLVAFIALLTAFFIILTTMSMGLVERMSALGTMRCVGVTRGQLAGLVAAEVVPIGLVGLVLGIPIGLGLTWLGASMVPNYVQGIVVSRWGLGLALIGGAITVLAAAGALVVQVARISPLEAANPQAKPTRLAFAGYAALAGAVSLGVHQWMLEAVPPYLWLNGWCAFAGMASLYLGYVLLTPVVVLLIGTPGVHLASAVLGVRPKLARDQIGRSPWRSAAVCWMLMVGLSLIVYLGARTESMVAAWDFPKRLPSTFVWSPDPVPYALRAEINDLPGVRETTVVREFPCKAGDPQAEATSFLESFKQKLANPVPATFVAGEMDTFLEMAKLGFKQGNMPDAQAKLRRGGFVLLPPESARTYGLNLGDKITLSVGSRVAEFEVAGVVESPALDIAVTFFQADSYMMLAAAGSFLGTLADAERCFGIDSVTMFMMNIDLAKTEAPPGFESPDPPSTVHSHLAESILAWRDRLPEEADVLAPLAPRLEAFKSDASGLGDAETLAVLTRYGQALSDITSSWKDSNAQQRWNLFRERLVLRRAAYLMDRPFARIGSLRTLKEAIDNGIRKATLLMSAIPGISLLVASLGVGNLMMVNVSARSRQVATVRAVGGTKSQIIRLILAEALTLGLLGSVIGVTLGLHSAYSAGVLSAAVIGIESEVIVPWSRTATAVGLTLAVCLLAGLAPARRAARSNIVEALSGVQ